MINIRYPPKLAEQEQESLCSTGRKDRQLGTLGGPGGYGGLGAGGPGGILSKDKLSEFDVWLERLVDTIRAGEYEIEVLNVTTQATINNYSLGNIGSWSVTDKTLTNATIVLDAAQNRITVDTIVLDGAENEIRIGGSNIVLDADVPIIKLIDGNSYARVSIGDLGTNNWGFEIRDASNSVVMLVDGSTAQLYGAYIELASITADKIVNATITGTQIAAATITGSNIAVGTITSGNIEDATITSGDIAAATILAGNIAAGAIETGHLANLAVQAGKIDNLTITAAQIANLTITGGDSGKIAASTITENNIVANTITAASIAASTITTDQIAANTIVAANIAANTITASEIAANTITASEIAAGTITATEITGSSLSAIYADLGTITAGTLSSSDWAAAAGIRLDLGNKWLKMGGSNVTAAGAAAGVFLGLDTSYKLYVGDGSNDYFKYDGTNIEISLSKAGEALTVKSGADIVIESGGDLKLESASADSAFVQFIGDSRTFYFGTDYDNDNLVCYPDTDNTGSLYFGADINLNDQYFADIHLYANSQITFVSDGTVEITASSVSFTADNIIHDSIIKGWINFDGTGTISITDSYNVTSITDHSTGYYTVTWATDFGGTDYAVIGTVQNVGGTEGVFTIYNASYAAGSFQILVVSNGASAVFDSAMINCIAIGDQ